MKAKAKITRRCILLAALGLMAAGCAASNPSQSAALQPRVYSPSPAPALAFDPPGAVYIPYLSRDGRGITAYGGFQSLSTEYYDVQTSDDQLFFENDSTYERRVVSDRTGVILR